jgi:hypothetical protein
MEDTMCWEIDYRFFEEQRKAQEKKIKEEQRAGVVDQLLKDANKQAEQPAEATPAKEVAPAKQSQPVRSPDGVIRRAVRGARLRSVAPRRARPVTDSGGGNAHTQRDNLPL